MKKLLPITALLSLLWAVSAQSTILNSVDAKKTVESPTYQLVARGKKGSKVRKDPYPSYRGKRRSGKKSGTVRKDPYPSYRGKHRSGKK